LGLNLDMEKQPLVGAIEATHLDQFVHGTAALLVVRSQGLQLGVEELGSMKPVDRAVYCGEAKVQERLEETLDRHLPRRVELIGQ
jgi:hypothetical protein